MKVLFFLLSFLFPMVSHCEVLKKPIIVTESTDFKNQKYFVKDQGNFPALIIGSIEQEPSVMLENITISNIIIDGNKSNQDYEIWDNKENYIRNNCITVRGCRNVVIKNCTVFNARSGNIVIEKECSNIVIEKCQIFDAFFDGIACYDSGNCIIRDNNIFNNHSAGLSFDLNFNNNLIENNFIWNNDLGIFLRFCHSNIFSGNVVFNRTFDFYLNQVDQDDSTLPYNNRLYSNRLLKNFIKQSLSRNRSE
jgi:parallel beta-helix repeat protein